jgi:serine/threonine protein kinase
MARKAAPLSIPFFPNRLGRTELSAHSAKEALGLSFWRKILSSKQLQSRIPCQDAVRIVATVAEALQNAHKQGIIHRDIKPANIIIDRNDVPYVLDFGLALREEETGHGPRNAGTPVYMSPEQARGEGHRVDGRSDIFSLGIVFYELLTGQRPFQGESTEEILEQILNREARPPRVIDERVP